MAIETPYFLKNNQSQNNSRLFIVEGTDDALFISSLLEAAGADPSNVGIVQVEGTGKFPSQLKLFLKSPSYTQGINKSIAIICDADENPETIRKSLNDVLALNGEPNLISGSHCTNAKGVKFGLFIMPDCTSPGDLESLCLGTVSGSSLEVHADTFINNAKEIANEEGRSLKGSIYKRKAQVYLAGFSSSLVRGAGQGYMKDCFDSSHASLQMLRDFIDESIK
jgi:hypothetical protein